MAQDTSSPKVQKYYHEQRLKDESAARNPDPMNPAGAAKAATELESIYHKLGTANPSAALGMAHPGQGAKPQRQDMGMGMYADKTGFHDPVGDAIGGAALTVAGGPEGSVLKAAAKQGAGFGAEKMAAGAAGAIKSSAKTLMSHLQNAPGKSIVEKVAHLAHQFGLEPLQMGKIISQGLRKAQSEAIGGFRDAADELTAAMKPAAEKTATKSASRGGVAGTVKRTVAKVKGKVAAAGKRSGKAVPQGQTKGGALAVKKGEGAVTKAESVGKPKKKG